MPRHAASVAAFPVTARVWRSHLLNDRGRSARMCVSCQTGDGGAACERGRGQHCREDECGPARLLGVLLLFFHARRYISARQKRGLWLGKGSLSDGQVSASVSPQPDDRLEPALGARTQFHRAAVVLDEPPHDREAEAAPLAVAVPPEAVEGALALLRRQPGPFVENVQLDPCRRGGRLYRDARPRRGSLDRVLEQVVEHLPHAFLCCPRSGHATVDAYETNAPLVGEGRPGPEPVPHDSLDVDASGRLSPDIGTGEREQSLNEVPEPIDLGDGALELGSAGRRDVAGEILEP